MHLPVAASRRAFRGGGLLPGCRRGKSDGIRRCAGLRCRTLSFSSPLTNFTASTGGCEPAPPLRRTKNSALPVCVDFAQSTVRRCCSSSLCFATVASTLASPPASEARRSRVSGVGADRSATARRCAGPDPSCPAFRKSVPGGRRLRHDGPAARPRRHISLPCRDCLQRNIPSPACPSRRSG